MRQSVVVLDSFIPAADLSAALEVGGLDVEVVAATEIPSGPGVVALLVGPETVGLDDRHLAALPDLRLLAATSAGYDHLPVDAAVGRGIRVTRAVDYCTDEVADHALALTVGLLRSTAKLDAAVHRGDWDVVAAPPRRIAGTVLGLFGFGLIGHAFALRAHALGMSVLASGRSLAGRVPAWVEVVEWDELLQRSDVLSLHVPLTDDTAGIVDAAALERMRRGSYLINVSRGGLIDHDALGAALRDGQLAGAAIDVLPVEPPDHGDPILAIPNLVITPHAAWYSPDVASRLARQSAVNLLAVLEGRTPKGVVG